MGVGNPISYIFALPVSPSKSTTPSMIPFGQIAIPIALVVLMSAHPVCGQNRSSRWANPSNHSPDGILEPWKVSDVACAESGIVDAILTEIGKHVRAGEPLASLDTDSVELQLLIAIAQADSNGREQSVRSDVELNQRKVSAFREARQNQYSSQLELERAIAELSVSQGRLLAELQDREVLRLHVKRLQKQLEQHTIVAPIDGIVVQIHKQLGEFVAPTSPEVVRIVDVSKLRASFFLRIEEVETLENETSVRVRLHNGQVVPATVEHIAPFADSESGLIEVRVLIENQDHRIRSSRCTLLLEPEA